MVSFEVGGFLSSLLIGKKEDLRGFMYVTFLLPNFLQDSLNLQRKKKLKDNSIVSLGVFNLFNFYLVL